VRQPSQRPSRVEETIAEDLLELRLLQDEQAALRRAAAAVEAIAVDVDAPGVIEGRPIQQLEDLVAHDENAGRVVTGDDMVADLDVGAAQQEDALTGRDRGGQPAEAIENWAIIVVDIFIERWDFAILFYFFIFSRSREELWKISFSQTVDLDPCDIAVDLVAADDSLLA
jgi:hypothetical protein